MKINISVATFIPKPHTPFQWEPFDSRDSVSEKQRYMRGRLRNKNISLSWHDYDCSLMEAVFARGDRRLSAVLEEAFAEGAVFDGWTEYFNFGAYLKAFEKCGLDFGMYLRERDEDEILPWDYLDMGVTKEFLLRERRKAYLAQCTPGCNKACSACGLQKEGLCRVNR